jgi:DNA-binding LacI/PurR family transcriptional regulator
MAQKPSLVKKSGTLLRPPQRKSYGALGLVLAPDQSAHALPSPLFQSILAAASEQRLHLSVANLIHERSINEKHPHPLLDDISADGLLIYFPGKKPAGLVRHIEHFKIPYMWLDRPEENNAVRADDYHAAYEATRQLLELGHRRIALVLPQDSIHYSVSFRQKGYSDAMREAQMPSELMVCPTAVPPADWREQATLWLQTTQRPTAILAYNPEMAFDLYAVARGLNWQVPRDLSLVAFHDTALNLFGVRLSTVKIPYERVGQLAVQQLIKKISRPTQQFNEVLVPYEWNEGATLGTPRALIRKKVKPNKVTS